MTRAPGHETRDLPPGAILVALGGIFVLIAVTGIGVAVLLHNLERRAEPAGLTAFPAAAEARTGPPLEVDPAAERVALEARARARLQGYAWTDRDAGLARIPIERAMALLVARGWPDPEAPAK